MGVAAAIWFYTKNGYIVSLPMTEATRYDLIVDDGERLCRVQCKTTGFKRPGSSTYEVQLATSGGNQSWNRVSKHLSSTECDRVFIYRLDGVMYEYPIEVLDGKGSLRLGPKQDKFIVG